MLHTTSSLFLFVTLALTGWFLCLHWINVGQEPDWKSRVLPLLPFFLAHSFDAFLRRFTPLYTESFLFLYNAFVLHQLFQLFLFFFNKQCSLHFQNDAYAKIEIKKSSQSEYLPDTIQAKTNYCFLKCVGYFLLLRHTQKENTTPYHEQNKVDESHFLLVYGAKFLRVSEVIMITQIFIALFFFILTLSIGHLELYARHFYVLVFSNLLICSIVILCILFFLIITERLIHPFNPRFKLALIVLPIFTTALLQWILPLSLTIFIIQLEQIFLLISSLWVFSPSEHNHILSVNTIAV